MATSPKYWSNCGAEPDTSLNIEECPKCHSSLHRHSEHMNFTSRITEQLPHKSNWTAALVVFIGGLFALLCIGHIYVGKVGRGIAIWFLALFFPFWQLCWYLVLCLFAISTDTDTTIENASMAIWILIISVAFGTSYLVFFVWQIFNPRILEKKFNESVRVRGKDSWGYDRKWLILDIRWAAIRIINHTFQ